MTKKAIQVHADDELLALVEAEELRRKQERRPPRECSRSTILREALYAFLRPYGDYPVVNTTQAVETPIEAVETVLEAVEVPVLDEPTVFDAEPDKKLTPVQKVEQLKQNNPALFADNPPITFHDNGDVSIDYRDNTSVDRDAIAELRSLMRYDYLKASRILDELGCELPDDVIEQGKVSELAELL